MPDTLYVGLQDDDKIVIFAWDGDSGKLTKRTELAAAGGPSVMAITPDRKTLYVGCRTRPSIASYRLDPASGGGAVPVGDGSAGGCADVSGARPHRPLYALRLLPGRLCRGVSDRGGWQHWDGS